MTVISVVGAKVTPVLNRSWSPPTKSRPSAVGAAVDSASEPLPPSTKSLDATAMSVLLKSNTWLNSWLSGFVQSISVGVINSLAKVGIKLPLQQPR